MKRIFASAVAITAIALALTGCGRSSDTATGSTSATTLSDGKATGDINVWAMGAEGDALSDFVADFEAANPDAKVTVTAVPWASAHDKIQTAIAAGNGPDVLQVGTTWMADFGDAFATVPSNLDTSGIFSGSLDTASVGGSTVGVPWYVDTRVIYYRTDIAEKAGWTTAPTTWDELYNMAQDMQKVDGVDYGIRLSASGTDAYLNTLWAAWSNGASLTNDDGTEWTLDTDAMKEAFTYTSSFFTNGIANVNVDPTAGDQVTNFVDGTTPMFIDGPSLAAQLNDQGGADFTDKYATAVLPTKVSSTSFVGGSNLAVLEDSKNADSAWKLVQWLTQPEVQVNWYKATTDLPSVQSAWDDEALSGDAKLAAFGEQLNSTQAPPAVATWAQVNSVGQTVLEQINRGTTTVADGLANLQSQAASIGME